MFFAPEQLDDIERCNIRIGGDGGLYSGARMSQAIERLRENLTKVEWDENASGHSYEKYCVQNTEESISSFFSRDVWVDKTDEADDVEEAAESQWEEEILLEIEVLRRSCNAAKEMLLNELNEKTGLHLVFVSWWNYALLRILNVSSDTTIQEKSLRDYTAVKIMLAVCDFVTKDLADFLKPGPGSLRTFHKQFGVDFIENVVTARRVMNFCDILDKECAAVEAQIENLQHEPGHRADEAKP